MKLFKDFLKKLSSTKLSDIDCLDKCEHDWEVVDYIDWEDVAKEVSKREGIQYEEERNNLLRANILGRGDYIWVGGHLITVSSSFGYKKSIHNKVCLDCGKCYSGFEMAVNWLQRQYGKKEKDSIIGRKRAEMAKKLWEETCIHKYDNPKESLKGLGEDPF